MHDHEARRRWKFYKLLGYRFVTFCKLSTLTVAYDDLRFHGVVTKLYFIPRLLFFFFLQLLLCGLPTAGHTQIEL